MAKAKARKAAKRTERKAEPGADMLYVLIRGKRHYIDNDVIRRYDLKAGDKTPFTNLLIHS